MKAVAVEVIERKILFVRGHKVMLDSDLAMLYGVSTKVFNQAIKRNQNRFPPDFMFQLDSDEYEALRSQIVTLKQPRGKHRKYLPYVFSEQGIAMLSGILNSERAVNVNIEIMRTFVRIRKMLISNTALARKLKTFEKKYDEQFKVVFEAIYSLMDTNETKKKRKIGFNRDKEK